MLGDAANTAKYRTARDRVISGDGIPDDFEWPDIRGVFNWGIDWFDVVAEESTRPALLIVEPDGASVTRTYDELRRRSNQVARWLAGRGVGRGDRVIVMLGNQVELWECTLALIKLGAVTLPTTTAVGGADLADRVARGHAQHTVCTSTDVDKVRSSAGSCPVIVIDDPDSGIHTSSSEDDTTLPHPQTVTSDPLLLYFTSGTTSLPKLVLHTQVSYPVGHLSTVSWLGLRPGDVHLNISSPGWAKHAWSCFFAPFIAEATVFVFNYAQFDAPSLLEELRENRVTTFCAPPTVWRMLIAADLRGGPGSLRELISAGEPLNPEVIAQIERHWGLVIRDGYGQTETTALIGNVPEMPVKPGSMGRPLPGQPVVLVDPITGQRIDGAGEGEICLDLSQQPLALMRGYESDAGTAIPSADGCYHTGDLVTRDADGYVTYVGRTDDVFKASDYKVSPFELESVLIEHPAVAEAAVVPTPDPVRLAVPKAYVALRDGHEPSRETALSILAHARERLSPHQRVRRLEFATLPKTISGKIRRVELRQREESRSAGLVDSEFTDDELRGR